MEKINTFWNWFRDNNNEIANLTNESDQVITHHLYWLNELLKDYCIALEAILVLPKSANIKPELIITTKDIDHCHSVFALVEHAPRLKKWKIVSLQLPKVTEVTHEDFLENVMQEIKLKTEGSTVIHEPNINSILVIRFRSYTIICSLGCADDAITYFTHNNIKWPLDELSFIQVEDEQRLPKSVFNYYEMCYHLDIFHR